MGEPLPPSGTPNMSGDGEPSTNREPPTSAKPQYLPYRPPGSEYTPPASPQPLNPYGISSAKKGFGSLRSKHPANLEMESAPASAPAYERPVYSPSPSSSPPLPPSLPSPHFPPRQRAPSLLRHAAASSPLNEGFPRAEQAMGSPTFSPMVRQGSGPGPTSDPRLMFNPLASNPINHNGPSWRLSRENSTDGARGRARGLTSSSQAGFVPHPPLRAATSIPDYGQYRGNDRPNPSGAYRPNRGGANWSHNDHYPLRHFRPEESRASFRSAWTNASSSFIDASGTERSSMATGRSSILSDHRTSVYSADQSGDRDISSDAIQPTEELDVEEDVMSVEDVIDSYCYGNDEELSNRRSHEDRSRLSPSPAGASDSEPPGLSQTYSQSDRESSHLTSEPYTTLDPPRVSNGDPVSYAESRDYYNSPDARIYDDHSRNQQKQENMYSEYLPPLQLSPLHLQYSPTSALRSPELIHSIAAHQYESKADEPEHQPLGDIYKDLKELPPLPKNKSRLSRQDWVDIQSYSHRRSKGMEKLLEQSNDSSANRAMKRPPLAVHVPPIKQSNPLPEVDEDEAYPRRASTSVFDRRSTLLEFTKALPSSPPPPTKSKTLEFGNPAQPTGRRQSGQTLANPSPASSLFPPIGLPRLGLRKTTSPTERDRYGFKKATDKITVQQYDAWYHTYEQHVSRRKLKWISLMEKEKFPTSDPVQFPEKSEKVRRYARKGYPPEWRGAMWWFYSNGQQKLGEMPGLYASLVERVRQGELNRDDREAIERDLDRTFPDNIHFRPDPTPEDAEGESQEEPAIFKDLREVLQCFALNNPNIGYCQSLNFIAGLLLLFMKQDVEKVFVLLTIITQYHLPGAHARSLANTEVNVLMMLIKDYLPKVWASINDTDLINNGPGSHVHPDSKFQRQPTVALSCTSWFMSLFVGVLPIEVVLRVWDAFLYEGPRALYRYALAIFKLGEPEIRRFHPGDGELFMTVQNLPRKCLDPNILHDIAFVKKGFGSLSQNIIDQKRMFWQQQLARERSRKEKPATLQKTGTLAVDNTEVTETAGGVGGEDENKKSSLGGLRRKASRRFFKKDKA